MGTHIKRLVDEWPEAVRVRTGRGELALHMASGLTRSDAGSD